MPRATLRGKEACVTWNVKGIHQVPQQALNIARITEKQNKI